MVLSQLFSFLPKVMYLGIFEIDVIMGQVGVRHLAGGGCLVDGGDGASRCGYEPGEPSFSTGVVMQALLMQVFHVPLLNLERLYIRLSEDSAVQVYSHPQCSLQPSVKSVLW